MSKKNNALLTAALILLAVIFIAPIAIVLMNSFTITFYNPI